MKILIELKSRPASCSSCGDYQALAREPRRRFGAIGSFDRDDVPLIEWGEQATAMSLKAHVLTGVYSFALAMLLVGCGPTERANRVLEPAPRASVELPSKSVRGDIVAHSASSTEASAASVELSADWSLAQRLPQSHDVIDISFSSDGRRVVTASTDGSARVWDVATGALLRTLKGHSGRVETATFSPEGTVILTAGEDGTARLWNASTGAALRILKEGRASAVSCAKFSPDGLQVLTCHRNQTAKLWNAHDGKRRVTLGTPDSNEDARVEGVFSPDGSKILISLRYKAAQVWDASDGALLATFAKGGIVADARFSPDGRLVAIAGPGPLILAEVGTWRSVGSFSARTAGERISFSADSSRIAIAHRWYIATIWRARTAELLATMTGHTEFIRGIELSPDGSLLLTHGDDSTVRVWNAITGAQQFYVPTSHASQPIVARFSPDGSDLAMSGIETSVILWTRWWRYH